MKVGAGRKKAIQSFRLRLHSGLGQRGTHSSRKRPRGEWGTWSVIFGVSENNFLVSAMGFCFTARTTMQTFQRYLNRWRDAGLIDDATASSIRAFESADAQPSGRRWQVILTLVLGGILLGAGVLLFVAANWDDVSPGWRLTLVLAMLTLFHGVGIAAKDRFAGFATAMHALGTVAAGAAIALVGQIFNMQEHWPAAVMLWALCALAGWWLLGDQFQQTLSLLLVPAWLISEWMDRASVFQGASVYLARVIAVLATVYLTGFLHSRKRVV